MKNNLITKFKAVVIGLVALATLSFNTMTEQTPVNAKAKTVTVQKKTQHKKGNKGKHNKKKKAKIRKKAKKIKPKAPSKNHTILTDNNIDTETDLVPDLTVNTPKIDVFSVDTISKYYLLGSCFTKNEITYGYDNVASEDQQDINEAVKQINDLQIVKLQLTKNNPDITIHIDNHPITDSDMAQNSVEMGVTYYHYMANAKYKNLNVFSSTDIYIHKNVIDNEENLGANPKVLMSHITLHELGHALGLDHIPNTVSNDIIMNATCNCFTIPTNDGLHQNLDQYYKNGLAIIYKN